MALRGDLADASPAELLASLAGQHASGCLAIDRARTPASDRQAEHAATLHLRNGEVYAAGLAGGTFLVGTRLVTSHSLAAEALTEALEAQRRDLSGWRLGEILVHLGHVHADVVEKISIEQVMEISTEVFSWRAGSWKFRAGERTRAMLPRPLSASSLLTAAQARSAEWRELLPAVGGRRVPIGRTDAAVPLSTSRELVALLRAADEQPGAGLEACCHAAGLSLLEGARLTVTARSAGLLLPLPVEERIAVGEWPAGGRTSAPSTTGPTALALAPRPRPATRPGAPASYALARLLELDGPALDPVVHPPVEASSSGFRRPETAPEESAPEELTPEELTPEEIAADLAPEREGLQDDSGHEAMVLDLSAARAARSAELAAVEEAATASALAEQLERERAESAAEERAVAAALREAAEARVAAEEAANRARIARALELATTESTPEHPVADAQPELQPEPDAQPGPDAQPEPDAQPGPDEAVEAQDADAPQQVTEPVVPVRAFLIDDVVPATPVAEPVSAFTTTQTPPQAMTAGERLGMFSTTRDPLADTASLMRELSSLGDAEDGPAENRPAPRPAAAPAEPRPAPEKKRKGLFGR